MVPKPWKSSLMTGWLEYVVVVVVVLIVVLIVAAAVVVVVVAAGVVVVVVVVVAVVVQWWFMKLFPKGGMVNKCYTFKSFKNKTPNYGQPPKGQTGNTGRSVQLQRSPLFVGVSMSWITAASDDSKPSCDRIISLKKKRRNMSIWVNLLFFSS